MKSPTLNGRQDHQEDAGGEVREQAGHAAPMAMPTAAIRARERGRLDAKPRRARR